MKVSILVPVYGVEKYIEKCAISLFEQTYKNIEYIFVDDCTPDSSIDILYTVIKRYPERENNVHILHHKKNCGLAQARNSALDVATGNFILNVDSDDYLELDAVEILCRTAYTEKADVVVFGSYIVFEKYRVAVPNQYNYTTKQAYIKSILKKQASSCVWGKFISHKLYTDTKIKAIPGLNQGEDYAVIPRLLYYANHIVILKDCLYNYTQYNEQAYTKSFRKEHVQELLLADKILSDFFETKTDGDLYKEDLIVARLRTKTYMLKIAKHVIDIKEIAQIYSDNPRRYYSSLSFVDRLLLFLLHIKCYKLILLITKAGFELKKLMSIHK